MRGVVHRFTCRSLSLRTYPCHSPYPRYNVFSNSVRYIHHKMKDTPKDASDILIEHWQKGSTLKELPESMRPADSAAGYQIQRHIERLTSESLVSISTPSRTNALHFSTIKPLRSKPSPFSQYVHHELTCDLQTNLFGAGKSPPQAQQDRSISMLFGHLLAAS